MQCSGGSALILRRAARRAAIAALCATPRERAAPSLQLHAVDAKAMGLQHFLFPVVDEYSDPNAWNSDEHFPIKLALALAAAALALAAAQRAQKRPTKQRKEGVLGERCDAPETYSPDVLFPIPRTRGRRLLGLEDGARSHSKVRMCGTVMKCRGSIIEDGRGAAPWSSGSRASRRASSSPSP